MARERYEIEINSDLLIRAWAIVGTDFSVAELVEMTLEAFLAEWEPDPMPPKPMIEVPLPDFPDS